MRRAAVRRLYILGPLLVLLSLLVMFVVLETLLRGYAAIGRGWGDVNAVQTQEDQNMRKRQEVALAEPHSGRIFELRANAQQVLETQEFVIDIAINSRHLRDVEHELKKPRGVYRILALGDSFTFGWGVNLRDTWWSRLGLLIGRDLSPRPVEVLNLGVYMYTFDQQVQRLEDFGLDYEPDIIVAGFYYPHVVTISTHAYQDQETRQRPRIVDSTLYVDKDGLLRYGQPVPFEGLRRYSALADLLISRLKLIQYRGSRAARLNDYELLKESREPEFEEAWQRTTSAYQRLRDVARGREIPLVIFAIPRDMQIWPEWKKEYVALSRQAPFTSTLPQRTFARMCETLRVRCLDLLPRFKEAATWNPETHLYYGVDPHWTPAGHALAGQLIRDYLVDKFLKERLAVQ